MARRSFSLNRDPHVIDIDGVELLLEPEIMGDEFLDAYSKVRDAQKALGSDMANVDPAEVKKVTGAIRGFLSDVMLPESREAFAEMRLPDRVLTQMLEFVIEVYGAGAGGADGKGGTGGRPSGRPSGSAPSRRNPGTR